MAEQGLAETAANSRERFEARRLLPGMAKRLREAGMAAPVVAASVTGWDREIAVSVEYGGQGNEQSITSPVYTAIGQVGCTIGERLALHIASIALILFKIKDLTV